MRFLWDPADNTVNTPALMLEAQSTGQQDFHHQTTTTSITTAHPHPIQNNYPQNLIFWHGSMIQLPLRKAFQQHHWTTQSGLKTQSQIDMCASMRHLSNQTTSVPTLPIQKHNLQDKLATIYTTGCSRILLGANGLQWHLIRSSWHNDDNKWQWHSWSCEYFMLRMPG